MANYPYRMQLVVDPDNPRNVVAAGSVSIYDSEDTSHTTLLALTDPSGVPIPNPITSNANGFTPPFVTSSPEVLWVSGPYTDYFQSYKGMRDEAVAAAAAAESAAANAGAEAAVVATAAIAGATDAATAAADSAAGSEANAAAAATAAANAAALVGAPADSAIAAAVSGSATATKAALNATFLNKNSGIQRKQAAVYEKPPVTSQGVSVFNVTTTTGCARPTEHNAAGLFITNPASSSVTVKIGLGQLDTLNAPEAFGGTYTDVAPGVTWTFNGIEPVWIKTASGSTDVIIDQEVYA